jgi:hypothetical protein
VSAHPFEEDLRGVEVDHGRENFSDQLVYCRTVGRSVRPVSIVSELHTPRIASPYRTKPVLSLGSDPPHLKSASGASNATPIKFEFTPWFCGKEYSEGDTLC